MVVPDMPATATVRTMADLREVTAAGAAGTMAGITADGAMAGRVTASVAMAVTVSVGTASAAAGAASAAAVDTAAAEVDIADSVPLLIHLMERMAYRTCWCVACKIGACAQELCAGPRQLPALSSSSDRQYTSPQLQRKARYIS